MPKLTAKQQASVTSLLGDLLVNGFTLQESLRFMRTILPREKWLFQLLEQELSRGTLFYECMARAGLAPIYVAQLRLAEVHGDLVGTLNSISQQIIQKNKQRNEIIKVASYPIILLVFLFGAMIAMREIVLPQLMSSQGQTEATNIGMSFIIHGPVYIFGITLGVVVLSVLTLLYLNRKSALKRSGFLAKIPFFSYFYRYYHTSFFASEWGKLLNQGLEMKQIFVVMGGAGSTALMKEIAEALSNELSKGETVSNQISQWSFFQPELSVIIQQGEATGKLGDELLIYSERLVAQLNVRMSRVLTWVQPLVFLVVALLIVLLYTGLLLPIYEEMENLL